MQRVLLIDDDVELCRMLAEYLEGEGFRVHAVHDGERGAAQAVSGDHDVVVLDVMLPGLNGVEALRRIRSASHVPVLMLTARGDEIDRVVGLEVGADDYLSKPCSPRELVARLRAILRRTAAGALATGNGAPVTGDAGRTVLQSGQVAVRPGERIATWAGTPLDLTSTEFNMLEVLVRHAGRVVSKGELSEHGLGRPLARFDRSVDMHVSHLRRKLGQLADGRAPIQTVRGIGYQYVSG